MSSIMVCRDGRERPLFVPKGNRGTREAATHRLQVAQALEAAPREFGLPLSCLVVEVYDPDSPEVEPLRWGADHWLKEQGRAALDGAPPHLARPLWRRAANGDIRLKGYELRETAATSPTKRP